MAIDQGFFVGPDMYVVLFGGLAGHMIEGPSPPDTPMGGGRGRWLEKFWVLPFLQMGVPESS